MPIPPGYPEQLTVADVARILGSSTGHVHNLLRRDLPYSNISPGTKRKLIRISRDELDKWRARHGMIPQAAPLRAMRGGKRWSASTATDLLCRDWKGNCDETRWSD